MDMKEKVLVIDDDRNICELVGLYLAKEGYEVISAFDGAVGLRKFESEKPNIIILDIMMPGMSGIKVLRHIKDNDAYSQASVIMISTCSGISSTTVALSASGRLMAICDCLTKLVDTMKKISSSKTTSINDVRLTSGCVRGRRLSLIRYPFPAGGAAPRRA